MEETLDTVDDEEIEEEADAEVDKVLFELTDGKLGQAGKVGGELPVCRDVSALKQAVLIRRRTRKRRRRMWPRCRECRGRCRTSSAGEGAVRGFGWTGVKCHRGKERSYCLPDYGCSGEISQRWEVQRKSVYYKCSALIRVWTDSSDVLLVP